MTQQTSETPSPVQPLPGHRRRSRLLLVCGEQRTSQALPILQDLRDLEIVITAERSAVASMLTAGEIDVVLLESLADGTSIANLCRDLRNERRFRDVAILTLVDSAATGAVEQALASGTSDVIETPPDPTLLAHRVRQLASESAASPTGPPGVDGLTRLPDRNAFRRLVAERITGLGEARPVAVILLDIDRFKKINDSLGHEFGNLVLEEFARRLSASLGGPTSGRALGRYGGDEFVVMLGDLGRVGDVAQAARRILRALAEPLVVQGHEIFITASVGAAVAPADGETAELLLRNAETAMYAAKKAGRDTFRFYTDPMSASVVRKFDLENKLRRALERDELEVVYQPIVQARRQTLVGFEALLRWRRHGQQPSKPEEFIPMAEETGLIVEIGEWVLREACLQGYAWNRTAISPVRVTVNISHRQLRSRGFVNSVARILDDTGLDARLLELEITESSVVRNERETLTALHQLKVQGIRLAVDDFGTGHSALSYLKKFPLNTLKIDQSFTRGITTDADDAAIITATINMAHGLNMTVVAEGVELEEQLYFLSQHQCDEVQGFLFSLPLDTAEAGRRLQTPDLGSGLDLIVPAMRISTQTVALLRDIAAIEPLSLVVTGGCMRPLLDEGDRIRVRGRRIYWPGDIVAFHRADGRLLVHRVLGYVPGRRGWSMIAKGDHLSREDEPVPPEAIIGQVVECRDHAAVVGAGQRGRAMLQFLRIALRRSLRTWASATSS